MSTRVYNNVDRMDYHPIEWHRLASRRKPTTPRPNDTKIQRVAKTRFKNDRSAKVKDNAALLEPFSNRAYRLHVGCLVFLQFYLDERTNEQYFCDSDCYQNGVWIASKLKIMRARFEMTTEKFLTRCPLFCVVNNKTSSISGSQIPNIRRSWFRVWSHAM